jgi:hypothetical protein
MTLKTACILIWHSQQTSKVFIKPKSGPKCDFSSKNQTFSIFELWMWGSFKVDDNFKEVPMLKCFELKLINEFQGSEPLCYYPLMIPNILIWCNPKCQEELGSPTTRLEAQCMPLIFRNITPLYDSWSKWFVTILSASSTWNLIRKTFKFPSSTSIWNSKKNKNKNKL